MDPKVVLLSFGLLMPSGTRLTLPTLPQSRTHKESLNAQLVVTRHFQIISHMAFPPFFQKGLIFLVRLCILHLEEPQTSRGDYRT